MNVTNLRKLHEAASPGPWKANSGGHGIDASGVVVICGAWSEYGCGDRDNAALIAATRNALPFLLDVVEAARGISYDTGDPWVQKLYAALDALDAHLRGES